MVKKVWVCLQWALPSRAWLGAGSEGSVLQGVLQKGPAHARACLCPFPAPGEG